MAIGQISAVSYSTQQVCGSSGGTQGQKQEDKIAQELVQLEQSAKAAQDSFNKRIELIQLKAKNNEIVENLQAQQDKAELAYQQMLKSKNSNGCGNVDSEQKGFMRWLSNAGTAIWNIGKSVIGFDKDGNWDPIKCIKNVAITAAAIGVTFIPYVGPIIGYGLLTAGVIGGGIGVAKGMSKLDEAERSGDQSKIDEAQQDICGNAFIGITSAFGLRGIGKAFRTSSSTAEVASSATVRTSRAGKCAESVSNFGRDITINAFKATKYNALNGVTPSFMGLKSWEKQYNLKNQQMSEMFTKKIAQLDEQILAETNIAKRALLQEQKQLLEANYAEFRTIGNSIKTKADYDKLVQDNMAQFNQEYAQSAYPKSPIEDLDITTGNITRYYNVNGTPVTQQELLAFQNRMIRQQRAIEKELHDLIKAKENMMRTFARNPKKHKAALDEYISTTDVKRSIWKPSTWAKTDELIAIGGKNPGYTGKLIRATLTAPGSNVPKALGTWNDPIHSGALMFTTDLSPEETQAQLDAMQTAIDGIRELKEKMVNAETTEEYSAALTEYQQLVAAANGEQQTTEEQGQSQEQQ